MVKWLAEERVHAFLGKWNYQCSTYGRDQKDMDLARRVWEVYRKDPVEGREMFLKEIEWIKVGHDRNNKYPDLETCHLAELFSEIADRNLAEGVLEVLDRRGYNPHDHLTLGALLVLAGKICGKDAVEVLAKYTREESDAYSVSRYDAIKALGEVGRPEAVPHLVEKLGSIRMNFLSPYADDSAAYYAGEAILRIGVGAIPHLEEALGKLENADPRKTIPFELARKGYFEFNEKLHGMKISRVKELLAELKLKSEQSAKIEERVMPDRNLSEMTAAAAKKMAPTPQNPQAGQQKKLGTPM